MNCNAWTIPVGAGFCSSSILGRLFIVARWFKNQEAITRQIPECITIWLLHFFAPRNFHEIWSNLQNVALSSCRAEGLGSGLEVSGLSGFRGNFGIPSNFAMAMDQFDCLIVAHWCTIFGIGASDVECQELFIVHGGLAANSGWMACTEIWILMCQFSYIFVLIFWIIVSPRNAPLPHEDHFLPVKCGFGLHLADTGGQKIPAVASSAKLSLELIGKDHIPTINFQGINIWFYGQGRT